MKYITTLILLLLTLTVEAAPKKSTPAPDIEVTVLKSQLQVQYDLCDAITDKVNKTEAAISLIQSENEKLKENTTALETINSNQTLTITNLEKDTALVQKALSESEAKLKAEKLSKLETGRERDIFILLFSVLSTLYFYPMLAKFLNSINTFAPIFQAYTWLPILIAPVIIFIASFLGIRILIQYIVHLIF